MRFGSGRGRGRGRHGRSGMGGGRGSMGLRPEICICPHCGTAVPHRMGIPCYQTACPNCGSGMTRQFNVSGIDTSGRDAAASPKPVVDPDACTGCQNCIPVCPEMAIEMRDDKAFIMAEKCANCRSCIPACPSAAIK